MYLISSDSISYTYVYEVFYPKSHIIQFKANPMATDHKRLNSNKPRHSPTKWYINIDVGNRVSPNGIQISDICSEPSPKCIRSTANRGERFKQTTEQHHIRRLIHVSELDRCLPQCKFKFY